MNTDPADQLLPAEAPLEDDVLRSLRRIIRAVDLYNRKLVTASGVSGPQLTCLQELAARGPVPAGKLADAVSLSAATVCGILNRLETRDLVRRERQTTDKRRVLVSLTETGKRVLGESPPPLHDCFLFQYRGLPAESQENIDQVLKQVVEMMSAGSLDAAPLLVPGHSLAAPPAADSSKNP